MAIRSQSALIGRWLGRPTSVIIVFSLILLTVTVPGASSSVDTIVRGNAQFHDAELPGRPDKTTTGQAA